MRDERCVTSQEQAVLIPRDHKKNLTPSLHPHGLVPPPIGRQNTMEYKPT